MEVLILGASGQIGSFILKKLSRNPLLTIRGISRKNQADLIRFDPYCDNWETLGKTDIIINCVGQIQETKDSSFSKIHIGLTERILRNREVIGNPRIIQISALGARIDHPVKFLSTKAHADEMLLKEEKTCVIRPSVVCTPGTMLVKKLQLLKKISKLSFNNAFLPRGFVDHKVQPILIEDFAELIEKLCIGKFGNKIIEAVGPDEFSFKELIDISAESSKRKIKIKELPKGLFEVVIERFISPVFPKVINTQQFKLLFEDNIASLRTIEAILGRKPDSTLEFWKRELGESSFIF